MAALPSPDSATAKPGAAAPAAPLPINLAPCCVHTPPLRVNAHVAPMPPLSPGPPRTAVLPSSDSATDRPCWAPPTAPLPISLAPCWVQTPPLRVNTHAAPRLLLSALPPTMAVLPSSDRATESPWKMKDPTPPVPTSFGPCCVQTPPLRVNTHAAPTKPLSLFPPTMAVLPSPDSATEAPWLANPPPTPPPTSFGPSCVHTPPLRVKTHAAPMKPLSPTPPTMAVLPSADSATEVPCMAGAVPTVPLPTSFGPCCIHAPPLRVKTQAAPAPPLSLPPPTMAVLPSADSATERPWLAVPTDPLPTSFGPCCANCAGAGPVESSSAAQMASVAHDAVDVDDPSIRSRRKSALVQTRPGMTPPSLAKLPGLAPHHRFALVAERCPDGPIIPYARKMQLVNAQSLISTEVGRGI